MKRIALVSTAIYNVLGSDISFSSYTGYQTTRRLPAIDKDNFDYEESVSLSTLWIRPLT